MTVTIRPLAPHDFPHWLPLWNANNLDHRDDAVTTQTWTRLIDEQDTTVNGLTAIDNGHVAGILHYILHPTTGSLHPACYMQDLFVDKNHRKKGIARKLVQALGKAGIHEHWARIYWLADHKNEAAQALYKNLGTKLDFSVHVMMVG